MTEKTFPELLKEFLSECDKKLLDGTCWASWCEFQEQIKSNQETNDLSYHYYYLRGYRDAIRDLKEGTK